ncbi:MAG: iron-containing alcohol dehydrogenase [Candidatus Thorarchaeota archaeon]
MVWWFGIPKVIFGEEAINELDLLEGRKALIITDSVVNKLGFPERICKILATKQWESAIWDGAEPDPRISVAKAAASAMREFGPDWIIAVGGGSVMDTAKAAWILYEHPDTDLKAVTPLQPIGLRNKARLICIPTTAGTGSDATGAVVIREDETGRKFATANRELVPDIAILEPEFVKGLPKALTAYTGMDALTHAVEMKAVKLVFEWLPISVNNLEDLKAREKMLIAANLGGMSFSNSQVALAHSLGHCMGSVHRMQHGMAVGMALPYTIEYNCTASPEAAMYYSELAALVGIKIKNHVKASMAFAQKIRDLMTEIGAPQSFKKAGIKKKQLKDGMEKLVKFTMMDSSITMNPRDVGSDTIEKIYNYMWTGKPIDF